MHKLLAVLAAGLLVAGSAGAQTVTRQTTMQRPDGSTVTRTTTRQVRQRGYGIAPVTIFTTPREARRCPPGLAKRHNGCVPPGLARHRDVSYPHVSYYRPHLRPDRFLERHARAW